NGVTAALLVQSGWTGVNDIFSGLDNFLATYAPRRDPSGLISGLGERYEVARITIKKWSVGAPIQPALDALEMLLRKHPFDKDKVEQVIVRLPTSGAVTVDNRKMPDICLQHMIAVMIMDKAVTFRSAHDKTRMNDPAVLHLRSKVKLIPDSALEHLMPKRAAIVEVMLAGGTHLNQRVDNVRGTPDNPMTRDEVIAKARDLVTPVFGDAKCNKLIEKIFALEDVKDIRELRPLLQQA
ncbi:MAG: MmgE/PrpD family protein, partial [Terriglobia bacterium]